VETWHILIYVVGAVGGGLAGMISTALLYYLVCRFVLKDPRTLTSVMQIVFANRLNTIRSIYSTTLSNKKRQAFLRISDHFKRTKTIEIRVIPVAELEARFTSTRILNEPAPSIVKVEKQPIPIQTLNEPVSSLAEVDMPLQAVVPELLTEFEHNYKIAREFSGGNLISLQTDIWDTSQHAIKTLPGKLQNELDNIYGIIKMLNNLVWFSTEFQRHSSALNEQYVNLLTAIADKLNEHIGSPLHKHC
jgi:hypothetical protein